MKTNKCVYYYFRFHAVRVIKLNENTTQDVNKRARVGVGSGDRPTKVKDGLFVNKKVGPRNGNTICK